MLFRSKYGTFYFLNINKWRKKVSLDFGICKIVGEEDGHYLLENGGGKVVPIHTSIIHDNHLRIVLNRVRLSDSLYQYYFAEPYDPTLRDRYDALFRDNIELILKHRKLVLKKAEYYLLAPNFLISGLAYTGGIWPSLGSLIESIESGKHIRFDKVGRHEDLYLLKLTGSPFSGGFGAACWSKKSGKVVFLSSQNGHKLPMINSEIIVELRKLVREPEIGIDFELEALQQLVAEIQELEKQESEIKETVS